MGLDLVIRGATVVTPGRREAADIGIAGGRIAQLGGTMAGTQELAAGGLLAIPGGVDAHTHLVHQGLGDRLGFPVWVDDFWSGSRAAIAGGSDADIALWDPGHRRTIAGARMQSLSGYSVYDGWQVQGWPRFVVRRGRSCSLTARSRAVPVTANGSGVTQRPEYDPGVEP